MIISNPDLLREFRSRGRCELCGRECRSGTDPCHVFATQMGGGGRLDVRLNIVAGCRDCHTKSHTNQSITHDDMLAAVALREGLSPDEVERTILFLRSPIGFIGQVRLNELARCQEIIDDLGSGRVVVTSSGVRLGEMASPSSRDFFRSDGMLREMQYHQICDLFDRMDDEGRQRMKESIIAEGVLQPAVRWKHPEHGWMLIDGKHRWEICAELGIKCPVIDFEGDEYAAIMHGWTLNVYRRELTKSQKAAKAALLESMLAKAAKARQVDGARKGGVASGQSRRGGSKDVERIPPPSATEDGGKSRDQAAAMAGVNPHYVTDIKAIKKRSRKLFEQVSSGELTIPQALKVIADKDSKKVAGGNSHPPVLRKGTDAAFDSISKSIGKLQRDLDDLNRVKPGGRFHDDAIKFTKLIRNNLVTWRGEK